MLILALFILIFFNSQAVVSSLNEEGKALLIFRQSILEDPEGSMNNWNSSDDSPCSWNGITCKDQRVVSVSIPKKKLSGFLSSSLGSLSQLRHLNLRSNRLNGSLNPGLFGALGLQSLVLYENLLSGSLPSEVGRLSYLQTLDLSKNFFNGSLPVNLIGCRRLKTLALSQNNFTGSLPSGFGAGLVSLEELNLSYNIFSGVIPSDLGNLSNLQGTVDLSHNMFSGSIPPSLGNLPEKIYIDLTYNNLSGPIPLNGALMNKGPTAFLGNPGLCGHPLKNPCSSAGEVSSPSSYPYMPTQDNSGHDGAKGLTKGAVIAIIAGDVIGICVIGLLFSYCYLKICVCGKRKGGSAYGFEKGGKRRKGCLCFKKDESDTLSEHEDQYDLVPLDHQVAFDLDELLKASAFVLGKSGIGIVYKVVLEDGHTFAVRRLGEGGSQRFKEFRGEVEAIGKLRHPNIVTLWAYYWSVEEKLLIYDFVPNRNLATALHGKPGMVSFTPISWSIRLKIIKGTAKGLFYLHECSPKKYVHGDLKPSNILLGHNMEPKISDFGLGRLANIAGGSPPLLSNRMVSENLITSTAATLESCYQAPEAQKMVKPSQKSDVYSYGVILLEMITGRTPIVHVGSDEMDIVNWLHLCIEERKPLSDVLDPHLAHDAEKEEEMIAVLNIAIACVQSSSDRRPSMRYILEVLERLPVSY